MARYASFAASAALAGAFAAVVFVASGGGRLDVTTGVEIGLILGSGALIALAVLRARPDRIAGWPVLAAFVLYTAVVTASIAWSVQPSESWIEANRTLAYLATFGAAVAIAHLAPRGWTVLLRALLLAGFAVLAYAVISRVFPVALAPTEIYARLGDPFEYWNALGTTAALLVPPILWLGTRRSGHAPANALAYPLLGLAFVVLFLSFSRGAIAAAALSVLLWVWYVPLRLRTITLVAVAGAGAAPVIVWALSKDAFTKNQVPLDVRRSVASEFGVFLIAMGLLLLAIGLLVGFRVARRPPRALWRLRVGAAAAVIACVVPIGLFTALSFSDRGVGGTLEASVDAATSARAQTPGGPDRLTTASSSRARYWREAGEVFEHNTVTGSGAGTFRVARLRFREPNLDVGHAHGFVVQTMADLGVIGLAAIVALSLTWLWAAARAVGLLPMRRLRATGRRSSLRRRLAAFERLPVLRRRRPRGEIRPREFDAERVALVALALSALVFGLHSTIDWTWFVPGCTVMALTAAGFVAGRAMLGSGRVPDHTPPRTLGRIPRYVLAAVSVVAALAGAWAAWQPQRSAAETDHAFELLAKNRLVAAAKAADRAREINPLSPDPLLAAASIDHASGQRLRAERRLAGAVRRFPGQPQVWVRLAEYQLDSLGKPRDALRTLRGALYLDPRSRSAHQVFYEATRALRHQANIRAGRARPDGSPPPPPASGAAPAPAPGTAPTPGTTPGPTPGRPVVPPAPAP